MRATILTLFIVLLLAPAVRAADVADRIQARYDALKSFRAEFSQVLTNAASGEQEKRSGTILFRNPSLVRWITQEPEKELLVVGKEAVWDFFPDENLAVKYRNDQVFNSKTMVKFLSGQANLKEDFVVESQGEDHGWQKFKLIPHEPEPTLVLAYMWVDPSTDLLRQVLLVDFFGNGNQVTLADLTLDLQLKDDTFSFTPPDGVEVQDNTQ